MAEGPELLFNSGPPAPAGQRQALNVSLSPSAKAGSKRTVTAYIAFANGGCCISAGEAPQ